MPRRALLLLPLLLVAAALFALRGCADDTRPAHDAAPRTGDAATTVVEGIIRTDTPPDAGPEHREGRSRAETRAPEAPSPTAGGDETEEAIPTVRGVVVTADGRPLRGRSVLVLMSFAFSQTGQRAVTDENGAFAVPGSSYMPHEVEVRIPLDDRHDALLIRDEVTTDEEVRIVVPRITTVVGTLVGRGGDPLPDVAVQVSTAELRLDDGTRVVASGRRMTARDARLDVRVFAGQRVSFELPEHPSLTLAATEHEVVADAGDPTEILLVATEGAAIEGVCVDQHGDPVAAAVVRALADGVRRATRADGEGRFRVTGLASGTTHELRAHAGGCDEGEQRAEAPATGARVELFRGRTLTGDVLRADGSRAAGAFLVLCGTFRGRGIQYEVRVRDGRFSVDGVLPAELDASIRPEDADPTDLGRLPEPGPDGRIRLVLPE